MSQPETDPRDEHDAEIVAAFVEKDACIKELKDRLSRHALVGYANPRGLYAMLNGTGEVTRLVVTREAETASHVPIFWFNAEPTVPEEV